MKDDDLEPVEPEAQVGKDDLDEDDEMELSADDLVEDQPATGANDGTQADA